MRFYGFNLHYVKYNLRRVFHVIWTSSTLRQTRWLLPGVKRWNMWSQESCILYRPLKSSQIVLRQANQQTGSQSSNGRTLLWASILTMLGLKKEEEEEDGEKALVNMIKRGILSLQREDYYTAEMIFHAALKVAQDMVHRQAESYIYDMLANLAFQKGDYPKAEKLFVELLKRMIEDGTPRDDNAVVEISLKLASIYGNLNNDIKAEEGFKFCIKTQKDKLACIKLTNAESMSDVDTDTWLLCAMSLDWYARYLMSKGRFKNAQNYFRQALEVSEKINGPKHPQTLVLLNDIGTVATLDKDFGCAVEYLTMAVNRGKETAAEDLPTFYCNLGATYMQQGDYTGAHSACQQALALAIKRGDKESVDNAEKCLGELRNISAK